MSNRSLFIINISLLITITVAAALFLQTQTRSESMAGFDKLYFVMPSFLIIAGLWVTAFRCYYKGAKTALKIILFLLCAPLFAVALYGVAGVIENTYRTVQSGKEQARAKGVGIFKSKNEAALAQAIAAGDTLKMKSILKAGVAINATGEDSTTLLLFALQCLQYNDDTNPAVVKILLAHGASPNVKASVIDYTLPGSDPLPNTPLAFCINTSLPAGATVLNDKSVLVTEWLLKAGAKPDLRELDFTSLTYGNGCMTSKLKLLLKYGADVNALCPHYYSPYWYVNRDSASEKEDFVDGNWTPIMKLAERQLWPEVLYLLEQGAKTDYKDAYGIDLAMLMNYYAPDTAQMPSAIAQVREALKMKPVVNR